MEINYLAVLLATVAQFAVAAFWYTALFGKLWGKMHSFDKLPKATQQKMMNSMGPTYGAQFAFTFVTSWVLAVLLGTGLGSWNPYHLVALLWLGFVVPYLTSSVLFGGTDPKWIPTKIAVQAGSALLCLEVAVAVLSAFS